MFHPIQVPASRTGERSQTVVRAPWGSGRKAGRLGQSELQKLVLSLKDTGVAHHPESDPSAQIGQGPHREIIAVLVEHIPQASILDDPFQPGSFDDDPWIARRACHGGQGLKKDSNLGNVFHDMPADNEVKSLLDIGRTDVPTVKANPRLLLGPFVAGVIPLGRGAGDLAEQSQEISLAAAHLEDSAARGRKVSGESRG